MVQWLKQSTAVVIPLGPFVDDADGKSAETGLTIAQADIRLSKNGGNIAQSHDATGATHDELGVYDLPLDTTDTDTLGRLRVLVYKSGALFVWQDFMVVTANVWDTLCSTDLLQADVTQLLGTAWLAPAVAGTPDVNAKQISGDATAADNLESYCDGNGNIPADVTKISGDATAADNCELMFDGTGYAGGTIKFGVDLVSILGTALTETVGGYIALAFKKVFDVLSPVFTAACVNQSADSETKLASIQTMATFIQNSLGGKQEIVGNQLICYATNNVTEVARFNLFDDNGDPTMVNVYLRTRV